MIVPLNVSGEVRNEGKYDAFPYTFWGYPLHARNALEDKACTSFHAYGQSPAVVSAQTEKRQVAKRLPNPISKRPLEPEHLCFLTGAKGMRNQPVAQWKKENGIEATYIFVSYTSEQFRTPQEQLFLHDIGEHAARAAGVSAYWVGCSCLGATDDEIEANVWRISDIVRGAHSLVIVVSNPAETTAPQADTKALLRAWGTRVWTLPEILLLSSGEVLVYARHASIKDPLVIHKRNFATMWSDSPVARELLDHYEGSLTLSSLELVTIALRCLHNRQKGFHSRGDMAYALMGLLRRRPNVVKSDSAFQAFARLSLANDNDLLLERLICVLPKSLDQSWYNMDDQYEASLWDIYPMTQICGIGENDTVLIDGARAAAIRWKAFAHVANTTKESWKRFFSRYAFRSASYLFITGISLVAAARGGGGPLLGVGAFFLTISLCMLLVSPYLIRILYTGKLWATQPWFFGFEGYLDLPTIERHIFGANMGHLKWSTNGSPLSVHAPNEHGECEGQDPTTNPET